LIVESKTLNTELTLSLSQKFSSITVYDGIPANVYFKDQHDNLKFLTYPVPKGNTTLIITARSKTAQFYPIFKYQLLTSD